jgi:hypothetical protein
MGLKVSGFDPAGALTGNEIVPVIKGGVQAQTNRTSYC